MSAAPPAAPRVSLERDEQGALVALLPTLARPFALSFDEGALDRRAQQGGELLFRATGAARPRPPRVIDATAGLCREAFLMASAGAEVWALEREEELFALAADALARSRSPAAARLRLERADALERLPALMGGEAEVVYLDPMFPHRQKSAAVAREAQVLQALAAAPPDEEEAGRLLAAALAAAVYRVVVKRPLKAPPLPGPLPTASLTGSVIRYDIYGKRRFP